MENLYLTVIFLFTLFFLLGSGVWIGLALMGVAYVGIEMFTVRPAGDAMITTIWTTSSSWSLTALPLFIWMGEILYRTKLSEDLFPSKCTTALWSTVLGYHTTKPISLSQQQLAVGTKTPAHTNYTRAFFWFFLCPQKIANNGLWPSG